MLSTNSYDKDLKMDENSILVIRGAGPIGRPGSAEVVNMQPSDDLIKQGIEELPCIGDGRQSGTSGSPSILNAAPESAVGGGLAWLKTGDIIRIDLNKFTADMLVDEEEIEKRRAQGINLRTKKINNLFIYPRPDSTGQSPDVNKSFSRFMIEVILFSISRHI